MKACCECGVERESSAFYRRAIAPDGLGSACKSCLAARRRRHRSMTAEQKAKALSELVNRQTKVCGQCDEEKPRSEFAMRGRSRDGMSPWCKPCIRAYSREHYAANREKRSAQAAEWYEANRERRNEQQRAWNAANLERLREYNAERHRQWKAKNPERWAELTHKARARRDQRIADQSVGDVNFDALWTGLCGVCGNGLDPDLRHPHPQSRSIDHILPLSRGGTHEQANLQFAHLVCNLRKGARIFPTKQEAC